MKYPRNMHDATQAAHEERSKAFFELLGWFASPIRYILRITGAKIWGVRKAKPAPSLDMCK